MRTDLSVIDRKSEKAFCDNDCWRADRHHLVCDRYALGICAWNDPYGDAGIGGYASRKINAISYMLYSLGGTGSYLVFFADPDGWAKTMLGNGTEQGYIDTMQATGNSAILAVMLIGTLAAALISAAVGSKMLKKQFEKAGITA